jgi:hypothetical protein
MDTKKKEMLGDYVRGGRVLSTAPLRGWDHDWPNHSRGVVIPHGPYDLARNEGYLHLGDSHDTSEFAADALLDWWRHYGCHYYPRETPLLLLCDGGGSNSSRRLVFKEQLERVVDATDLLIRVAHYPPGCSKYNPIEHRLFPHVTRKLQGLFLASHEMFRDLARQATTATGLRVFARSLRGLYELGQRATRHSIEQLRILYDNILPQWNHLLIPQSLWEDIYFWILSRAWKATRPSPNTQPRRSISTPPATHWRTQGLQGLPGPPARFCTLTGRTRSF